MHIAFGRARRKTSPTVCRECKFIFRTHYNADRFDKLATYFTVKQKK